MSLRALPPSLAVFVAANILRLMPYRTASGFGGWIGRTFGPRTRRHAIARDNLQKALPEIGARESAEILEAMWDNLGRTLGEYLHLDVFGRVVGAHEDSITFEGLEPLTRLLDEYPAVVFIGGHFGNWELTTLISKPLDIDYLIVYHAIHESAIDRLVAGCRAKINPNLVDSREGGKAMVAALKKGTSVGLLVDQKPRKGPLVPFFGRGAKTTTAPARLALRYRVPIVPVRVRRHEGTRFTIKVYPHIDVERFADDEEGAMAITALINRTLEDWVREDPSQWHWIHRRWPDSIR